MINWYSTTTPRFYVKEIQYAMGTTSFRLGMLIPDKTKLINIHNINYASVISMPNYPWMSFLDQEFIVSMVSVSSFYINQRNNSHISRKMILDIKRLNLKINSSEDDSNNTYCIMDRLTKPANIEKIIALGYGVHNFLTN